VNAHGAETKFTETRKMSQSLDLVMHGRNDGGRYFVVTRVVPIPARAAPADATPDPGADGAGGGGGSGDGGK
jgi:hypothetical protein